MTTATILPFTARRAAMLMSREAICRRARLTARVAHCSNVEIRVIDREADALLDAGEPHHVVLERCAQLARHIVAQRKSATR